jgi:S1-C subfamily serine protease
MSSASDWDIPPDAQPNPEDYSYNLDRALDAVVGIKATIPADAFTAPVLGTERAGNGVLIRADGLVLTIGYLVTEAETVWLSCADGRALPGHLLAFDQETGFGLVQALGRVQLPALPMGDSSKVAIGDAVVVAGAGGREHSVAAQVMAKQEFAGYWEYVIDDAIFTAPAHPNWGGAALIGTDGTLVGIGSLHLQQSREGGPPEHLNMIVPVDLLKPILDDLMTLGRPNRPPRPWLGMYATELDDKIVVAGLANAGPAKRANLHVGDVIIAVGGEEVPDLASLFRRVWSRGEAGVDVPIKVFRDGRTLDIRVRSADRQRFLKGPSLH